MYAAYAFWKRPHAYWGEPFPHFDTVLLFHHLLLETVRDDFIFLVRYPYYDLTNISSHLPGQA